jgi:hypothetical protein
MDALSSINRQIEGVQYGASALGTGAKAIAPADFQGKYAALPPGEQNATRAGMNAEIYRAAGAPANKTSLDELNALLPGSAQTGSNWNAEKLGTVYSPDAMQRLLALRQQGNQFRDVGMQVGGVKPTPMPSAVDFLPDAAVLAGAGAFEPHALPWVALHPLARGLRAATASGIGSAGKNQALVNALTQNPNGGIGNVIADLLARRLAGQAAGRALAPIGAGALSARTQQPALGFGLDRQ